jgi:peptide/nickel transport system permease protein
LFAYIARRLLATIPVMGVVAIFVFSLLYLSPGDPAVVIGGDTATAEDIEKIRAKLGLDRPFLVQFGSWLFAVLQGDLGISIFTNLPVSKLILQRVEPTIALTISTLLVTICVAIPLGVSIWADLLPVQGYVSISNGLWKFLPNMVLPSLALGMVYIALIARITRASMLEVLSQDYIRTAQSKGLSTRQVLLGHALKNASVPIVTTLGIGLALLISGVVVTESVFAIPGLGRLTVDAILRRDYPIIQGVILVFSAAYVLINLLIDVCYTFLDPRIRY